jgi:hypothetical protein
LPELEHAMEATLIKNEAAVETIAVESAEELKELTNLELMLVGGGIANVSFF